MGLPHQPSDTMLSVVATLQPRAACRPSVSLALSYLARAPRSRSSLALLAARTVLLALALRSRTGSPLACRPPCSRPSIAHSFAARAPCSSLPPLLSPLASISPPRVDLVTVTQIGPKSLCLVAHPCLVSPASLGSCKYVDFPPKLVCSRSPVSPVCAHVYYCTERA